MGRSGASKWGREVTEELGDEPHFSTSSIESRSVDDGDVLREPPFENIPVRGLLGGEPFRTGIEGPVPLGGCGTARGNGGIVESRIGVRGAKGANGGDWYCTTGGDNTREKDAPKYPGNIKVGLALMNLAVHTSS